MIPFYGLARQYRTLKDELLEATDQSLREGNLMDGPFTQKFERWLEMRTGARFAITMHSGTQALEILARAEAHHYYDLYQIKPKVKIPDLTYVATLTAFMNAGFEVELSDVDKYGILDPSTTSHDDLYCYLCPVGLYGAPPTPAKSLLTPIIVDGAQHWLVADRNIGSGMAISFDPTKNLPSSGNGGAIVTDDHDIYDFVSSFKNNGKNHNSLVSLPITGTNSRMSEQDCAQILVRSRYIDVWQRRRREIRLYYLKSFKDLPVRCFSEDFSVHADQKFALYTNQRDELRKYLNLSGIETKIHYSTPLSLLPIAKNLVKPDMLSRSMMLSRGTLSLPIYPELTDPEVELIAFRVREFFSLQ